MGNMGIDPAKKCARDMARGEVTRAVAERAEVSRWARGPTGNMGIDPVKKCARDVVTRELARAVAERAASTRGTRVA